MDRGRKMMREKNLKQIKKWLGGAVGGSEPPDGRIDIVKPLKVQAEKQAYCWKGLFTGYKCCLETFFVQCSGAALF